MVTLALFFNSRFRGSSNLFPFLRQTHPSSAALFQFDQELQAVYSSLLHYRYFLEGRPFTLLTNHKPLVSALTRHSIPKSGRQQHQLAFISEFHLTIHHTTGVSNVVADALSWPPNLSPPPLAAILLPVNPLFSPLHFAQQQVLCPEVQAFMASTALRIFTHMIGDTPLLSFVSTSIFHPLVPQGL